MGNLSLLDLLNRQPLELEELLQPLELVNSHPTSRLLLELTSRLLLEPANNLLELTSSHPSLQLPLPMSAPASLSAKLLLPWDLPLPCLLLKLWKPAVLPMLKMLSTPRAVQPSLPRLPTPDPAARHQASMLVVLAQDPSLLLPCPAFSVMDPSTMSVLRLLSTRLSTTTK